MKKNFAYLVLVFLLLSGCQSPKYIFSDNIIDIKNVTNSEESEAQNAEFSDLSSDDLIKDYDGVINIEDIMSEIDELIRNNNYTQAVFMLSAIPDNIKARELEDQLRYYISGDYIATGDNFVAAIDSEGDVQISSTINEVVYNQKLFWGEQETDGQEKVTKLFYNQYELIALNQSGSVLIPSKSFKTWGKSVEEMGIDRLDNVKQLYWDGAYVFALNNDGSIYVKSHEERKLDNSIEVVKIVGGSNMGEVYFLLRNGTIKPCWSENNAINNPMFSWQDIVDVEYSYGQYIGLKADGTCCVYSPGRSYQLSGWDDLNAISIAANHVIGLKRDGTVVVAENGMIKDYPSAFNVAIEDIQSVVAAWKDVVAVKAGNCHFVGLTSTGEILIAEYESTQDSRFEIFQKHIEIDTSQFHSIFVPGVLDLLEMN